MKIKCLKNLKKYGPWWDSFSSATVATVCGIVLTFGVTDYNSAREKERLLRTTEVWAMSNIGQEIAKIEPGVAKLRHDADVISTVMVHHSAKTLAECPDSLKNEFFNCFMNWEVSAGNSMETLPFQNMEVLKDSDDIHEISGIYELFRMLNVLRDVAASTNDNLFSIGNRVLPKAIMTTDADLDAAIDAVLSDSETSYYLWFMLPVKVKALEELTEKLKLEYQREVDRLGITPEEMAAFNDDELEDRMVVVKDSTHTKSFERK